MDFNVLAFDAEVVADMATASIKGLAAKVGKLRIERGLSLFFLKNAASTPPVCIALL